MMFITILCATNVFFSSEIFLFDVYICLYLMFVTETADLVLNELPLSNFTYFAGCQLWESGQEFLIISCFKFKTSYSVSIRAHVAREIAAKVVLKII